jgi:hypothetical protein
VLYLSSSNYTYGVLKVKSHIWGIIIALVIIGIIFGDKSNSLGSENATQALNTTRGVTNTEENTADTTTVPIENSTEKRKEDTSSNQISEPKYQMIYSIDKRYDGGSSYYILIDPIDVTNSAFMDDVKFIINKFVKENGGKISVEIFDDRNVLKLQYKLYGDLSLGRLLTNNENQQTAVHYIAGFSGELETGLYFNSLYFFPSADSTTPQVGTYATGMEYNPE